jgi:Predicted membrane protein
VFDEAVAASRVVVSVMGTILEVEQLVGIHKAVARACETIRVNDEQAPSRGSAALEPAALAATPASHSARTRGQVDGGAAPASSLSLTQQLLAWVREFIQFGMVGATAYVVDAGLFNLLQYGPLGVLDGHPNTAQFLAAATATLYSWIANRLWTYRGRTREDATREAILFFFANACGIGISQFCLLFTHHILGFTSALADNIAVYVVGFALGTAFRFFFYHYVVFTGHTRA